VGLGLDDVSTPLALPPDGEARRGRRRLFAWTNSFLNWLSQWRDLFTCKTAPHRAPPHGKRTFKRAAKKVFGESDASPGSSFFTSHLGCFGTPPPPPQTLALLPPLHLGGVSTTCRSRQIKANQAFSRRAMAWDSPQFDRRRPPCRIDHPKLQNPGVPSLKCTPFTCDAAGVRSYFLQTPFDTLMPHASGSRWRC